MEKVDGVFPKYTKTALWSAFVHLGPNNQGEVQKAQLQRLCTYVAPSVQKFQQEKQLKDYLPEKTSITFEEFIRYVQSYIVKPNDRANFGVIEEFCWRTFYHPRYQKIVQQWTRLGPSEECAFKLWRIFNYLSIDHTISPVEATCLLEVLNNILHGSSSVPLFSDSPHDAFRRRYSFWHLLNCVVDIIPLRIDQESIYRAVEELEDEVIHGIMKQGTLVKKGHVRHNWKERWFVLTPGILKYYTSKDKKCLKGVVYVDKMSQMERIGGKSNHSNRFSLTCGESGKLFEIASPSFEAMESWISVLRFATTSNARTLFEHSVIERQKKLNLRALSDSPETARLKEAFEKYDVISRRVASKNYEKRRTIIQLSLGSDGEYSVVIIFNFLIRST